LTIYDPFNERRERIPVFLFIRLFVYIVEAPVVY